MITTKSQFVLKLARNSFTTINHVEKWSELSKLYQKLGYDTPDFLNAKEDRNAFTWMYQAGVLSSGVKPL